MSTTDATYQRLLRSMADEAHRKCLAVIEAQPKPEPGSSAHAELMANWLRQWRQAELETEALYRGAFALRPRRVLELDDVTQRLLVASVEFMADYARSSLDTATLSSERQVLEDEVEGLDNLLARLR